MGGSAIRTHDSPRRLDVPADLALERINARFTAEQVAAWRDAVRPILRRGGPLGEVAREIGLDDVAPGSGEAFLDWLDEDWPTPAARRLQALLWHLVWAPGGVRFSWEACDDWSEFDLEVRPDTAGPHRAVLVRTPHP